MKSGVVSTTVCLCDILAAILIHKTDFAKSMLQTTLRLSLRSHPRGGRAPTAPQLCCAAARRGSVFRLLLNTAVRGGDSATERICFPRHRAIGGLLVMLLGGGVAVCLFPPPRAWPCVPGMHPARQAPPPQRRCAIPPPSPPPQGVARSRRGLVWSESAVSKQCLWRRGRRDFRGRPAVDLPDSGMAAAAGPRPARGRAIEAAGEDCGEPVCVA